MSTDTTSEQLYGDQHVEEYLRTGGEIGYHWRNGTTILVLFTKGRKTGEQRRHALIFRPWGDDFLVVGSRGGNPKPPGWLVNLEADPEVEVQVGDRHFKATARIATDAEKPAMWAEMAKAWPAYDEYQTKTDRVIPVVVLQPVAGS
jgi:deazaflavin-dependent oxidoreductase (nitroreductase family)